MKFSCIPPRLKPRKVRQGLSISQGAIREHDEQYQMSTRT
jgi:hypothetical protein